MVKNLPAKVGDTGVIARLGRSHILQDNQACTSKLPEALDPCLQQEKSLAVGSLDRTTRLR